MSESGWYDDADSKLRPRMFFRRNDGMSRSLFQMEHYDGDDNPAYHQHSAHQNEAEYYEAMSDTSNSHPRHSLNVMAEDTPSPEHDSGRGSHDAADDVHATHANLDNTSLSSSIRQADDVVLGYDSDQSIGHFRPGSGSDDGRSDSIFDAGERPVSPGEEDTIENRTKKWNVFSTSPHLNPDDSKEFCFAMTRKVMKVLTYIVMLPCMIGLLMLSKGSVLIAATNIRPYPKWETGDPMANETDLGNETTYQSHDLRCKKFSDNFTFFEKDENGSKIEVYGMVPYFKCVAIPNGFETVEDLDQLSCLNPANDTGYLRQDHAGFSADQCFVVRNYWAWSVLLMICTPYVFIFLRCFWIVLFKNKKPPTCKVMIATLTIETLHTAGICILFFIVLPALDNAILALMFLLGVATIPGALKIFVRPKHEKLRAIYVVCDCIACLGQLCALLLWPAVVAIGSHDYDTNLIWSIPVSLVLVSVRWWENFVDKNSRLGKIRRHLNVLSGEMRRSRTKNQMYASLWKIGVSVLGMMFCMTTQVDYMDPLATFSNRLTAIFNFSLSQCSKFYNETNQTIYTISEHQIPEMQLDWVWVWLTNCCASLVCYFFARSAAKMQIQQICYSLPVIISTPLMFGLMIGGCELWNKNPCTFTTNELSGYLFYRCYHVDGVAAIWFEQLWFLLPIWWLSQLWIAWHIWFPKSSRLATADTLFVLPLYDGVLMEQSLLLNRERNDEPRSRVKILAPSGSVVANQMEQAKQERIEESRREDFLDKFIQQKDEVPMIYICATMWHETETEMVMMLKSILKLDIDQCARKNAMKFFGVKVPDYYEFEAHIFFDNAFDNHDIEQYEYNANSYVQLLCSVIDKAAAEVHEFNLTLGPPRKVITAYGGRLIWGLPGGNQLIVHLKDSALIRHKKRWSQVMYMYYFLGYKLWMDTGLTGRRKQIRAENTFLLALDGDVDFEPIALILLIDLMKRNPNLGAACGRIHPNGSGPMVWYQYFEYALGHWMQKATEHVIGCVLCSPGCFSLFRGIALMEDNVMARYTVKPTEARHHIQYDQGEDRWLCTLILQQGYRVEYCAASDSVTFAPEGFNEFFNQRRRWMPSTMANVFDLLTSWQHTTSVNDNISLLYIIYQAFLLGASIVGPGTIFMMMVGSMDVAFGGRLGFPLSTLLNFIPLLIFVILCYLAKSEVQLIYAQILTGLYVLVQMLVLIGILVEMAKNSLCYPTTVFFLFVSGTFVLAAVIHPQEFYCLIHGFTYYLAIPTMYMLLMIYSMCNLHVVSWGTREVKQTPTEKQLEEMKAAEEEAKRLAEEKKKKGISNSVKAFAKGSKGDDQDGWTWQCGDCCAYTCCPHEAKSAERILELNKILSEMEKMGKKFEEEIGELKKVIEETKSKDDEDEKSEPAQSVISQQVTSSRRTSAVISEEDRLLRRTSAVISEHSRSSRRTSALTWDQVRTSVSEIAESDEERSEDEESPEEEEESVEGAELMEKAGSQCRSHTSGSHADGSHASDQRSNAGSENREHALEQLEKPKELTWVNDDKLGQGPIERLSEAEEQFFQDLIAVYLHPLLKDKVKEERDAKELKDLRNELSVAFLLLNTIFVIVVFVMQLNMDVLYIPWPCGDNVKVEPIGFMFMVTFGVIMIIQIIGMLTHRTSTFLHIMSTTLLQCFGTSDENRTEALIDMSKRLGKLDDLDRMTMTSMVDTMNGTFGYGTEIGDDVGKVRKRVVLQIERNVKKRGAINIDVNQAFERRLMKLDRGLDNEDTNIDDLQRKLLGGATAGFFANKRTEVALKTYQHMRQSTIQVQTAPAHGTIESADYSVDYSSSGDGSIRPRGANFANNGGTAGYRYNPRSLRINPVFSPTDDPEADYD